MRSFYDTKSNKCFSGLTPVAAAKQAYRDRHGKTLTKAMPEDTVVLEEDNGKIFSYDVAVVEGQPFTKGGRDFSGLALSVKSSR